MLIRRRPSRRARLRAELGYPGPNRAVTAVLAIAALVVLAAVVGSARSCAAGGHQTHSGAPPSTTVADEGLSEIHDGYRFELLTEPAVRGPAVPVAFRILGSDNRPLTEYNVGHTKLLHFYVLRDDMSQYQHVHPELTGDTWRTTISVPDGGQYRLYAEFLPRGRANPLHPVVLGAPFTVPGDTSFVPLPAPTAAVTVGGLTVSRSDGVADVPVEKVNTLGFRITDSAGAPVDRLDSYLGAYAHMSAFNSISMGLLHQHPLGQVIDGITGGPELTFSAQFAKRGEHRLFLELSVDGQVRRAEFTVFVT